MSRMFSLRILSRRVLPITYLEVLNLYKGFLLLLRLLIGPYPVFHSVCLISFFLFTWTLHALILHLILDFVDAFVQFYPQSIASDAP